MALDRLEIMAVERMAELGQEAMNAITELAKWRETPLSKCDASVWYDMGCEALKEHRNWIGALLERE